MFVCPNCRSELKLSLVSASSRNTEPLVESSAERQYRFTVKGRYFELSKSDTVAAQGRVTRPIHDSYVEMRDNSGTVRKYPTKDLIRQAICLKYPDVKPETDLQPGTGFQSQRAEQIARGIGLTPERLLSGTRSP